MRTALVLAAGRGARVGGAKALMMIDGEPLALAHVRARGSDCDRVVVVGRAGVVESLGRVTPGTPPASRDRVLRTSSRTGVPPAGGAPGSEMSVRFVVSVEDDGLGPAGSIRAAVKDGEWVGVVLVTPVDVPPVRSPVVAALFDAIVHGVDAARFEHGHPIVIRAEILRDRYAREARPLRDVMASLGERVRVLPMPQETLPRTLDRIEDVVALTGAAPRFWSDA